MIRLGMWTLILLVGCAALAGAVRVGSSHRPPPRVVALLPDPACPAPCWQGLRPGYLTTEALHRWLDDSPPLRAELIRRTVYSNESAWAISLDRGLARLGLVLHANPQQNQLNLWPAMLRVGDVMAALGEPDYLEFYTTLAHGRDMLILHLYYEEPQLIVMVRLPLDSADLLPSTPVYRLRLTAMPWSRPLKGVAWQGFGNFIARYVAEGLVS